MMQTSVRDVVYVLFRHKGKILLFFLAVLAAVTAYTYLVAEAYRSQSKLLIRVGRESVSPDPSVSGPLMPVFQDRENEVNSEIAILTSQPLAEQVVDAVGPEMFLLRPDELKSKEAAQEDLRIVRRFTRGIKYAIEKALISADFISELTPKEKAVKEFMESLSVAAERRTNIIDVNFDAAGPELAKNTLDALVKFYLERHIAAYAAQASPQFFEDQEKRLKDELTTREQALEKYRTEHGIVSMSDQRENLMQLVSTLQKDVNDSVALVSGAKARVESLEKALASSPKNVELSRVTGRANPASDTLKQRLQELKLEETSLAARYPDTHRPLIDLRDKIKQVEASLTKEQDTRTEVTTGVDENHQALKLSLDTERSQYEAHVARSAALQGELDKTHAQLDALAGQESEFVRLQREVDLAEKEYKEYRDNLQRARISAALDMDKVSNVSVVQSASLPMAPVKPNKPLNIALGALLGLFGGVFLAFAVEYLDDSLNMTAKAEKRLGVPVLAALSEKEFKACR
jgi:uncharacterized protein involved in exopolysaccharide biosynthesis